MCLQLKNNKSKLISALPFVVTGVLSVLILLIVYAINGIYPFGTGSVVCDDMVQQTISNYTYFWDYLHSGGAKSLLFNWETAAGTQVLTTGFYILKPWEIIFTLLCPRNAIVSGIPFLIIFKITAAAISMGFFLKKEFKLDPIAQVFLSLAYAYSAFIVIYYTNMGWIDAAFMFPLLIMAALHMFRTGKWMPYFLMATYTLLLSIYIAFMVFMFLFLIGFLYLAFIQPKDTRKMAIIRFGLSSVLSLAASAVINVPSIFYMFRSTRYEIKSEGSFIDSILKILDNNFTYSTTKLAVTFLVSAALFAFLLILLLNFKKHKKECLFFGLSVLVLIIPVFFENINLIWHLGSYVSFPLRYLYMLSFILVCAAAFVIKNFDDYIFTMKGKKTIPVAIMGIVSAVAGFYLLISRVYEKVGTVGGLKYNKLVIEDCDKWLMLSVVLLMAFYIFTSFIGYKKVVLSVMTVVLIGEIGLLANVSFGTNSNTADRTAMYSLTFEQDALEMAEDLNLENDNLSRIKDFDIRLNSNYPMFFNYPALSNFTHLVSSDMTSTMESLGYSQIYTRVIDSVGTLLSDALLNMKHTFSSKDLDEYEYTYLRDIGESKLYENNFTLPIGLIVSDEFMNIDIVKNKNVFKSNNEIYTALTGDDSKLCTTEEFKLNCTKGNDEFNETIHIDGRRHVYLHIDIENSFSNRGAVTVLINGKKANLRYMDDDVNYNYPNNFHNELIDLGVRENEDINIQLLALKTISDNVKVTVGYFDYTKLEKLCEINKDNHGEVEARAKSLTVTVNADKAGDFVFIPVTYDEGWSCTVNGEKQDIDIAMSSFMAIELVEGENVIKLSYLPHGMKLGAIITALIALLVAAIYIIVKKKPIADDKSNKFLKLFEKVYYIGMIAVFVAIYLVPIAFTTYNNFIK